MYFFLFLFLRFVVTGFCLILARVMINFDELDVKNKELFLPLGIYGLCVKLILN